MAGGLDAATGDAAGVGATGRRTPALSAGELAGAEILRDITRGGVAGLIVGVVVGGIGGRIVMRIAALLVPSASGSITENGNVVGAITLPGTVALVLFVGLFVGAVAGAVWVTIEPWLPRRSALRLVVTVPIALGLGIDGLIEDRNPDFTVLAHSPAVVASLVLLVAVVGPALVLTDRWLDGRLPHPERLDSRSFGTYVIVAAIGALLTVTLAVPAFLGTDLALTGAALVVVGVCTLAAWSRRLRGAAARPALLSAIAWVALTVATVGGLSVAALEIVGALGAA